MPENRNSGTDTQAGSQGGTPGQPAPNSLEALAASLKEIGQSVQAIDQRNRNIQAAYTRTSQENARLRDELARAGGRSRRGAGFDDQDDDERPDRTQQRVDRLESLLADERRSRLRERQRTGFMSYRLSNADWKEYHDSVMQIVNDDLRVGEYASYSDELDTDGRPVLDVEKTYANVLRSVKLAKVEKAQAAAKAQETMDKEARDKNKSQAVISGSDASGAQGEQITSAELEGMSADEMLKRGLVKIDPKNPPQPLGI